VVIIAEEGLMRAVVIDSPGQVAVREVPDPVAGQGQVVIGVRACGICGTDLHIADGEFPPTPYPIIPGHEFAGEVVATGPGVPPDLAGDGPLVAVDPSLFCGNCTMCRSGRGNLCQRWNAIGDTVDGAFAEFVAVPVANVYPLPPGLNARQGALVEPVACAVHGMRRLGPVAQSSVAVFGAGTMGLLLQQLLLDSGAASVTAVDRVPERLAVARALGAAHTAASPGDLGGERFDVAVDATGSPQLIEAACDALRPGGRLLVFGVAAQEAAVRLSPFRIYNDELTIIGSMAVLHSFDQAIAVVSSGAIDAGALLGEPFGLDRFEDALASARAGRGIKVQVSP
jgi:2-desacetyl-2-hydroxyethyl bacteriochlorophyllide A dehydrogenase